jgi:hypothetical protein
MFTEVQNGLATNLGIGTFASGLLCSFILLLVVMFPMFILSLKSKANTALVFMVIVGTAVFAFEVAVLWMPVWVFIMEILLVALFFGNKFKDLF